MSNSASASASTSTNAPSISPSFPQSSHTNHASAATSSTSPSLPHSPETARQIAEARAALEASMSNIGSSLDHTLKSRAQNLHSNSTALDAQQKQLVKETEKMRKETDKLKKVAEEGAKRVKELGNVQNWAEMLERDFLLLGETMKLVREGDRESGWRGQDEGWETSSGSGSWSESESEGDEGVPRATEYEKAWAEVDEEEPLANESQIDGEGDTTMNGLEAPPIEGKGKGKEIEQHGTISEASAPTTTGSASASILDPSASSVHTTASTTS